MGWFFITQSTWHAYGINVIKSSSFTEWDSTIAMTFQISTCELNMCSALVKLSFSSRLSKSFLIKSFECLHLVRLKFEVATVLYFWVSFMHIVFLMLSALHEKKLFLKQFFFCFETLGDFYHLALRLHVALASESLKLKWKLSNEKWIVENLSNSRRRHVLIVIYFKNVNCKDYWPTCKIYLEMRKKLLFWLLCIE